METIRLGKTELRVTRSGFGALPIQRLTKEDAASLLRKAYDGGINFFDSANGYTDSEEKIGLGLSDVRQKIIIATKTGSSTPEKFWEHLALSLKRMKTDYIDIYQFHNPAAMPNDEMLACMVKAKEKGIIRHIGVTAHRLDLAFEEAESGIFETIQYPLSALSGDNEIALIKRCKELDLGVIAMKALAGGLLTSAASSMAYLRPYDNVVPIWGMQRESELAEVLTLEKDPPKLDEALLARIAKDRKELAGDFCRGCGYCMPCPAGIQINTCARMPQLLRRAPMQNFLNDEWQAEMQKIKTCLHCNKCVGKCPYSLNTPKLLEAALSDYETFLK